MKENYKNKGGDELTNQLKEKRNLLRDFRFRIAKGKARDVKTGRKLKKDAARILTELNTGKKQNAEK